MTKEAREKAIDDIQRHLDFYPKAGWPSREALQMALEALEQEPRKGHWIWELDETPSTPVSSYELNYEGWVCSCCHEFPDDICEWDNPDEPPAYRFCPNCGADMREVEE